MIRNPAEALDDARMKDLLARNLDKYMRRRGITQTELAKRANILKSTLNTYFTRKSFPNPSKLQALAEALGVSNEDLIPKMDRDTIKAIIQDEQEIERAPTHSLTAIPGRPAFSRLEINMDVPTNVAMQVMTLLLDLK